MRYFARIKNKTIVLIPGFSTHYEIYNTATDELEPCYDSAFIACLYTDGFEDPTNLANYVDDDCDDSLKIYSVIRPVIRERNGKFYICFYIELKNSSDKDKVKVETLREYINGQIIDGWAEDGIFIQGRTDPDKFEHVFIAPIPENFEEIFKQEAADIFR